MVLMKLKANSTGFMSGEYLGKNMNFTPILLKKMPKDTFGIESVNSCVVNNNDISRLQYSGTVIVKRGPCFVKEPKKFNLVGSAIYECWKTVPSSPRRRDRVKFAVLWKLWTSMARWPFGAWPRFLFTASDKANPASSINLSLKGSLEWFHPNISLRVPFIFPCNSFCCCFG